MVKEKLYCTSKLQDLEVIHSGCLDAM